MIRLLPEHLDYSTRKYSFPEDFFIDLIFEDFRPSGQKEESKQQSETDIFWMSINEFLENRKA
eukprot:CAMPEP_0176355694 /NCGR_PEP_ID=MMETSP0126-20121128/13472_1 /TAXON_ID=141414 ORGANISM="Strombidinopsis acuminatum, Strain SPMC142" /NCGR_SAMPLE_ID=MMETSP0126 /ASSEMBLY_ACC=CAM_ASM_000229 /LENGTH=62 /DNA_ID=CAMNT_0017708443 /DNA_START=1180 /DNA_END=1368 /DNA_ORIENTATION=-